MIKNKIDTEFFKFLEQLQHFAGNYCANLNGILLQNTSELLKLKQDPHDLHRYSLLDKNLDTHVLIGPSSEKCTDLLLESVNVTNFDLEMPSEPEKKEPEKKKARKEGAREAGVETKTFLLAAVRQPPQPEQDEAGGVRHRRADEGH